jgi:transcriptional regulator
VRLCRDFPASQASGGPVRTSESRHTRTLPDMYLPAHFEENRLEILHELISTHPLGTLVTLGSGGLEANHIPFELAAAERDAGTLRAHAARANAVWKDHSRDIDALVIFQGPHAYISPSWYATKQETGKVVPTWNYCVVHATGPLRVIDDRDWLRGMVERLTRRFESTRPSPWHVSDAPADFIEKQLAAIVGIEIPIRKLTGKWKVSQNRPEPDRHGVVAGLRAQIDPNAKAMADLVQKNVRPS